jgi:hypothetical protein
VAGISVVRVSSLGEAMTAAGLVRQR